MMECVEVTKLFEGETVMRKTSNSFTMRCPEASKEGASNRANVSNESRPYRVFVGPPKEDVNLTLQESGDVLKFYL